MMKLERALTGVRRLGFDTSPFIYFVERHARYVDLLREIFRRVDTGGVAGYSSVVTVTEVLTLPKRVGDALIEREYRSLLLHSRSFSVLSIDSMIAEAAADLRARYGLRTPDALQVATAVQAGCEAFLTNDVAIKRVGELRVLVLGELEL